jgi:hypothetical protein
VTEHSWQSMSERAKGQLMAEMAGALVRARQSLNPVLYLEEFRDLLKKHQTGNRALLESLLSCVGEDFFVALAEKVPEGDEAETVRFASVYAEVADLVRALAPASPLAKRREAEQQVLEGVFREINLRNKAEKAEKVRIVEKQYEKLLKARRDAVRKHPEVKRLRKLGLAFALFGVLGLIDRGIGFIVALYSPNSVGLGARSPLLVFLVTLFSLASGVLFGAAIGGLLGIVVGFLAGILIAAAVGWLLDQAGLFIILGVLVVAALYLSRYRQRVESSALTAEESNAYQKSIKNIEDHFRQKEKLEQARAILAAAKACPLSLGVVMQELRIGQWST